VCAPARRRLIFANRYRKQTALLRRGVSNRSFVWIASATVALLGCVLAIPAVSRVFAFASPTPAMLLTGVGAAISSLLWFEIVKRALGRRHPVAA